MKSSNYKYFTINFNARFGLKLFFALSVCCFVLSSCCDQPQIYSLRSDPSTITVNKPAVFRNYVDETGNCGCEYLWDFGDGSAPVKGIEASHTYTKSGSYAVKLVVKNTKKNKKQDEFSQVFNVNESTASVMFWTQDTTYEEIVVKLASFGSKKIDTVYSAFPGCTVNKKSGFFQDLPTGVYTYTATAKNFATWVGSVDLTKNTCNNVVLN